MIAYALYILSLSLAPMIQVGPVSKCNEVGPRLDGTFVMICEGHVVYTRDGLGNKVFFKDVK